MFHVEQGRERTPSVKTGRFCQLPRRGSLWRSRKLCTLARNSPAMPKAPSQRGLSAQQTGGVSVDTPSGATRQLPQGDANPLSLLTAFAASSPEGGAFGIFRPARIKLPLRGSWHRVAMTERVCRPLGEGGCDQREQTEGVISTFPPPKVKNPAEKRSRWFKKQFGCVILEAKVPAGRGNRRA